MSRVLFSTLGSLGDIHPLIAMGLEMRERGHSIGFATSPGYQKRIESVGFSFHPVRPDVAIDSPSMAPWIKKIMDPRKGPEVFLRQILFPEIRHTYEDLLAAIKNGNGYDLLVTGEGIYAAPIVAEITGIKWASTVCAPFSFFSAFDPPVLPPCPRFSQFLYRFGLPVNRLVVQAIRKATLSWSEPVAKLRQELNLAPGLDPIHEGRHSPQLVLATFTRELGKSQVDWPPATSTTGYLFYDNGQEKISAELSSFLAEGDEPLVFTLGSAAVFDPGEFYQESIKAALLLRKRAILLVGRNHVPHPLPPRILACDYLPFSHVFPRAAAVVHQGGAGTLAQTFRAGKPSLIAPYSHDQPDNAARAVRIGAARSITRKQYKARIVAEELHQLLTTPSYLHRTQAIRDRMASENGNSASADALERLLATTVAAKAS